MGMREMWKAPVGTYQKIAVITKWLDESNNGKIDPKVDDMSRILKIGEEAGEAAQAYIGYIGQNPRKGKTHELEDVLAELADVAITALCAIEHFVGVSTPSTQAVINLKLDSIMERAGIVEELGA